MICRNLKVNGRRTSLRMEPEMWDALYDVARLRGLTPATLVSEIDRDRGDASTTAALRVYILRYYREALREMAEAKMAKTAKAKRRAAPAGRRRGAELEHATVQ